MLHGVRLCVSLSVLLALSAVFTMGQAPVGSLDGTVHDPTAAVMPSVNVTVTNQGTGAERKAVTGADGSFHVAPLAPGQYSVKVEAEGFHTLVVNATVQVGQITSVDLVMQVGAATEVVSVQGEAAQISYDSHEINGVISRQTIQDLPLNGRDFLQLAMLEPGVSVSAGNNGQYNQNFNVNILGASSTNNSVRITVDGATVQDSVTGGTQQNFSQDVVQEFQLSSTNFDLSMGIGAGGAINIVTRSGTNDFHGSAYFFYRDHNMSAFPTLAHDPGEPSSPYFARKQEGFVFGGPIKKDKLFFFSSYERTDQQALFSSFPSDPLFQQFAVNADGPVHSTTLTEKLNWTISPKHSAFVRYSHDGNNSLTPPSTGVLPSDWNANTNWADSGVFSLVSVITPSTANEFRYSLTYWSNHLNPPTASDCPAPCLGLGGPNIFIVGVNDFTVGQATNVPQSRVLRRNIFADNVTTQKGSHSIKYGGYWEYQQGYGTYAYASPAAMALWSPEYVQAFNQQLASSGLGAYQVPIPSSFSTLQSILQLPVYGFEIGVGDINQPPLWQRGGADHDNLFHFYGEDAWKIRPRFTLNYGLAWSYESNALNHDINKPQYLEPIFGANGLGYEQHAPHNFSPMLGFAWAVTKDNKTVVRGGAAIYYDTWDIFNRLIERALLGPQGTGRVLIPDSALFSDIALLNGFYTLPSAIQPTSLASQPTTFTGAEFENLLPLALKQIQSELGSPNNTSLAVRNINLFKTAPMSALIPTNFRLPYSEHASIGVQRELRTDLVLSADFVFRQYLHQLITGADLNHFYRVINGVQSPVIPVCTPAQSLNTSAECSTGVIEANVDGGRSQYKGLLMKLDKRFSHRVAGTLSYAYASQIGYNGMVDEGNYFASVGPQAGHQTLTGSIMVDLPWRFQFSGITSFQSAPPFQPYLAGIDLNGNGAPEGGESQGSPLPGIGYNQFNISAGTGELVQLVNQFNQTYAGKTDPEGHLIPTITLPANFGFPRSFNSQDLRVTRVFRIHSERTTLSLFGECFNVFNIANLTGYSAALNSPGFGFPTQRAPNIFGSGGPRAFQLGTRLSF